LDTDNLKAITTAPNEPALNYAEQARLSRSKSSVNKMKGAAGLAASALLATSLMLSACGQDDDCIPSTPPTAGAASNAGSFGTPVASSSNPSSPNSSQFTSGQTAATSGQTYCRSRRTGAFYWYTGSRYYSTGSGSSSSSSS
jgi:hypothetical protein